MKKTAVFLTLVFAIVIIAGSNSFSQHSRVLNLPKYDHAKYHFGFRIGGNQMFFSVKTNENINTLVFDGIQTPDLNLDSSMLLSANSDPALGFVIGLVGEMKLGKYFRLRFEPGLSFGERMMNFSVLGFKNGDKSIIEVQKRTSSTHIDFPLVIKYTSKRLNNMRAYLLAGVQYSLDLASTARKEDENQEIHVKLRKNDVYFVTGVGFDFYNPWFKFGIEIRMNYGIFDLLKRENTSYTIAIDSMKSKIFQLILTFE